jgi:hypothetical protein
MILGKEYYTSINTKKYSKTFLVVLCELYLRFFTDTKNTPLFLSKIEYYLLKTT